MPTHTTTLPEETTSPSDLSTAFKCWISLFSVQQSLTFLFVLQAIPGSLGFSFGATEPGIAADTKWLQLVMLWWLLSFGGFIAALFVASRRVLLGHCAGTLGAIALLFAVASLPEPVANPADFQHLIGLTEEEVYETVPRRYRRYGFETGYDERGEEINWINYHGMKLQRGPDGRIISVVGNP